MESYRKNGLKINLASHTHSGPFLLAIPSFFGELLKYYMDRY